MRVRATARLLNLVARLRPVAVALARLHGALTATTRGRVLGRWLGAPVLVIETVGRRSGEIRRTPIIYLESDGEVVVSPANAGSDRTPAWWLNLRAAGEGVVIQGGRRRRVRPRMLEGAERDRAWREGVRRFPALAEYARYTNRQLPLAVLEPAVPAGAISHRRRKGS